MRYFAFILVTLFLLPASVQADLAANEQTLISSIPYLSDAIADGKELRYLGRQSGMDGWIAEKEGQIEIFYTTADGDGVVLGVLFDENGTNITREQMAGIDELQPVDTTGLNIQPDAALDQKGTQQQAQAPAKPNSPGERLFAAVTEKRHFSIGSARAPEMYLIVDPTCPFCKTLWAELADPYVKSGQVRANIIPVGALSQESGDITSKILGANDPSDAWLSYVADGSDALNEIQGDPAYQSHYNSVMEMMEQWQMSTVPYTVYRAANGKVKLVRGVPKDMKTVVQDLHGEG